MHKGYITQELCRFAANLAADADVVEPVKSHTYMSFTG